MAIEEMKEESRTADVGDYPLRKTASVLNDRLGLYLSPEQQRGLAMGLLVGVAMGAAMVGWSVASAVRRGRW